MKDKENKFRGLLEFELSENVIPYDLVLRGNLECFDLGFKDIKDNARLEITYGSGYYTKRFLSSLVVSGKKLIVDNADQDEKICEFLQELLDLEMVREIKDDGRK